MFNASMKFDLGDDVNDLRDMVHRWSQERVKPMAAGIDQKNEFPPELWKEMGDLGLLGMTVDEEYGGTGKANNRRRLTGGAKNSPNPSCAYF